MLVRDRIRPFLRSTIESTELSDIGERIQGKVRDIYLQGGRGKRRILIATDRQSAFDINWTTIPLKGQVLNQISNWWFGQISDIMPNHVVDTPDPNVTVVKELTMLPVEIVVRGYLTGSSKTSAWTNYAKGVRDFCGVRLPEGMVKNQLFSPSIITPTTKGEEDELISSEEIVKRGLMTQGQWDEIAEKALRLFSRGQEIAAKRGLILVDTKYEMGLDSNGTITLADEIHTPDSSRYWIAQTYQERFEKNEEPESLDKEFFRLWLREKGFKYEHKESWPEITDDVRLELAKKYIELYERMTGEQFVFPKDVDVSERIARNLEPYRSTQPAPTS